MLLSEITTQTIENGLVLMGDVGDEQVARYGNGVIFYAVDEIPFVADPTAIFTKSELEAEIKRRNDAAI